MGMKKYILAGCLAIIVAGWSLVKKADIFQPKEVVLPAISMDMARGMVKEKECYIVRITDSDEDEFNFPDGIIGTGKKKNQYF